MRVDVGDGKSSGAFQAELGVRQGCQLSPLLFSLFINDILQFFEGMDMHSPQIGGRENKMLLYADDIVLLAESGVGLQKGLDRLAEYCQKWGLSVDIEKTKV
jgi:hypothetical protein